MFTSGKLIIAAGIATTLYAGAASAELSWFNYGGHSYALTSTWSNWQNAETEAVSAGGHLVTINSATENDWLTTTFANTYNRNGSGQPWQAIAWIGYYLDNVSHEWKWVSGEPVSYTRHDYPGWPQGGEFAYLHLPPHPYAGTWNANTPHQDMFGYQPMGIIERSFAAPIPEPVTALLYGAGLAGIAWRRRTLTSRRSDGEGGPDDARNAAQG